MRKDDKKDMTGIIQRVKTNNQAEEYNMKLDMTKPNEYGVKKTDRI